MSDVPTMRVIDVPVPGGPEALIVSTRPMPSAAPDQCVIKVAAAGINRADIMQRRGQYPSPAGAPSYPGLEVSGTVVAVGSAIENFKIGDRVCALLQGGGYAEYCAVAEGQVLPLPERVSLIEAAALPEAYFTVWSNVFQSAALQAGEKLLVHGGASGIGTAAIQLAAALGSDVFTTVGSEDKGRFCESLGAKLAINYKTQDFVAEVRCATGNAGVDVILDIVAGDYVPRNLQALALGGRLVVIATQGGRSATIDLVPIMSKRLTITGSTLRPQSIAFKTAIKTALLAHVWPLFAAGRLRPIVDRVFPYTQAAAAHAYMESGEHQGKILLLFDEAAGPYL